MVHIGVIGCGKIAQIRHIPEYLAHPQVRIRGIYDLNKGRMRELSENIGCDEYSSYEELLADERIDGVSICTANHTHGEIAVKALLAGKHVLCEKPMAVNMQECERMIEAARDSGRILMIGQNQRLTAAHKKAKELLKEDVIGRVITFRSTFGHSGPENWSVDKGKNNWFFDKNRAFMGAMADLGIHKTDLLQFLMDSKVCAVTACMGTLEKTDEQGDPIGVDDNAICIYELENGCRGTVTVSWTYYGREDNSTVLYGTKGIMRIYEDRDYPLVVELKNRERIFYELEAMQTNENQTKSGVIDAFVDCIVENREPELSGESVISAMKAVFAAEEAARKGTLIRI